MSTAAVLAAHMTGINRQKVTMGLSRRPWELCGLGDAVGWQSALALGALFGFSRVGVQCAAVLYIQRELSTCACSPHDGLHSPKGNYGVPPPSVGAV